jgi:hypothetical protein
MKHLNKFKTTFWFYIVLFVTLVLIALNEFIVRLPSGVINYLVACLLVLLGFLQLNMPTVDKSRVKQQMRAFGIIVIVLTSLHFVLNSINIYNILSLPPLFYTLKLHRFISLSSTSIIQIISLVFIVLMIPNDKKIHLSWKKDWAIIGSVVLLLVTLANHTQLALATVYKDTLQVAVNTNTSFNDRITYRLGGAHYYGWVWPYTQFIIRHTPRNAVILIPPQSNVWKMEGNSAYIRWFLYPRTTVNINLDGSIPESAEYVLIALGECNEGDCGWPKIDISQDNIEYIALIDRETQTGTLLTSQAYSLNRDVYKWGIIKLKK